jgi:hypothetical protein
VGVQVKTPVEVFNTAPAGDIIGEKLTDSPSASDALTLKVNVVPVLIFCDDGTCRASVFFWVVGISVGPTKIFWLETTVCGGTLVSFV